MATETLTTRILYFARIRTLVGRQKEEIAVPSSVKTVNGLIDYLARIDEGCAAAFADRRTLRAAVNQRHVALDATFEANDEVAFFPPVTGG